MAETAGQAYARSQLLGLVRELSMVAYMEGRITANPADPAWPRFRRAVEIVDDEQQRQAQKEIRGLLRSGQVSKFELLRAGVR